MSMSKRIQRAVAFFSNKAASMHLGAALAMYLQLLGRNASDADLATATQEAAYNWPDTLASLKKKTEASAPVSSDGRLDWNLRALFRITSQIESFVGQIDIKKTIILRMQNEKTDDVFENFLKKIVSEINGQVGGLYYCASVTASPAEYNNYVISIIGGLKRDMRLMRRYVTVLRSPVMRAVIFGPSPLYLSVLALIVVVLLYLWSLYTMHPAGGITQLEHQVPIDIQARAAIWQESDVGLIEKLRLTVDFLHTSLALTPLALMTASFVLYVIRVTLVTGAAADAKIATLQKNLHRTLSRLKIHSSFIKVGDLTMTNVNTTIGTIESGAIVNIAAYMKDVTNTVTQQVATSKQPDQAKELINQLANKLNEIAPQLNADVAKQFGDDTTTLSNEMKRDKPRTPWYKLTLDSIKDTATAIGTIGTPIVSLVEQLRPLLTS